MARFAQFHMGSTHRVRAGRVRLLYDSETGRIDWVPSLYEDIVRVEALPSLRSPWDEGLDTLRALGHDAVTEVA